MRNIRFGKKPSFLLLRPRHRKDAEEEQQTGRGSPHAQTAPDFLDTAYDVTKQRYDVTMDLVNCSRENRERCWKESIQNERDRVLCM
uniref:Uncharacterized protein n=1 Tax=Octopus bimaculoides TaxID=37653 RepID=A0A0L8FFY0_OCTBM